MAQSPWAEPAGLVRPPARRGFSLQRVEWMIGISISVVVLVFGAQSFLIALGEGAVVQPPLSWWVVAVMHGSLVWLIAAGFLGLSQRVPGMIVAILFGLLLAWWPWLTGGIGARDISDPWIWYLCTVAALGAMQGFRRPVAIAYVIITPVMYCIVRAWNPFGPSGRWDVAFLDASYAIMVNLVGFALIVLFRLAAIQLDRARTAALVRYDEAVRQHALSAERIEVDAIVHDTVLSALQQAERAHTPQGHQMAVAMSARAIANLVAAPVPDPGERELTISAAELGESLRLRAVERGAEALIELPAGERGPWLPRDAGEAFVRAATQAIDNAVAHAGEAQRRVRVRSDGASIAVRVSDDGAGFDPLRVDPQRLGLRVSIIERVATFGGAVHVRSARGVGTDVEIIWPAESVETTGEFRWN